MPNDVIDQVRRYLDHVAETTEVPALQPVGRRSWHRRGAVMFAGVAAVVALSVGLPLWWLGQTPRDVAGGGVTAEPGGLGDCRGPSTVEEVVATASLPDGRHFEMAAIRPGPGAPYNGYVSRGPEGRLVGCNPIGGESHPVYWAGGGAFSISVVETLYSISGRVPPEAVTAEVTLEDGSVIATEVEVDGHFFEVWAGPGHDVSPGRPDPDLPDEAIRLRAFDAAGNVVFDVAPPVVYDEELLDTAPPIGE
ncbi:MAG TPA: hypothetical protein VF246_09555 [Acidimicrobiia bacterium]